MAKYLPKLYHINHPRNTLSLTHLQHPPVSVALGRQPARLEPPGAPTLGLGASGPLHLPLPLDVCVPYGGVLAAVTDVSQWLVR